MIAIKVLGGSAKAKPEDGLTRAFVRPRCWIVFIAFSSLLCFARAEGSPMGQVTGDANAAWFVLYHKYSSVQGLDQEAVALFREDCEFMRRLGVAYVIIEDYPRDLNYGAYNTPWSRETLTAFMTAAAEYGMGCYPYINPIEVSTNVLHGHPDWRLIVGGQPVNAFNTVHTSKPYYWRGFPMYCQYVCPATSWADALQAQVDELMTEYPCAGIYIDQARWSLACDEHSLEENMEALAKLVCGIGETVRSARADGKLIINDYFVCRPPEGNLSRLRSPTLTPAEVRERYDRLGDAVLGEADVILVELDPGDKPETVAGILDSLDRRFHKPTVSIVHWDEARAFAAVVEQVAAVRTAGCAPCFFFPFPVVSTLRDQYQALDTLLEDDAASNSRD